LSDAETIAVERLADHPTGEGAAAIEPALASGPARAGAEAGLAHPRLAERIRAIRQPGKSGAIANSADAVSIPHYAVTEAKALTALGLGADADTVRASLAVGPPGDAPALSQDPSGSQPFHAGAPEACLESSGLEAPEEEAFDWKHTELQSLLQRVLEADRMLASHALEERAAEPIPMLPPELIAYGKQTTATLPPPGGGRVAPMVPQSPSRRRLAGFLAGVSLSGVAGVLLYLLTA
jgi:hypothetical protein